MCRTCHIGINFHSESCPHAHRSISGSPLPRSSCLFYLMWFSTLWVQRTTSLQYLRSKGKRLTIRRSRQKPREGAMHTDATTSHPNKSGKQKAQKPQTTIPASPSPAPSLTRTPIHIQPIQERRSIRLRIPKPLITPSRRRIRIPPSVVIGIPNLAWTQRLGAGVARLADHTHGLSLAVDVAIS
jgi:hypothetical protein